MRNCAKIHKQGILTELEGMKKTSTVQGFRAITPLAEALTSSLELPADASLWQILRREAERTSAAEPMLSGYLDTAVLDHDSFETALSFRLASKLESSLLPPTLVREVVEEAVKSDPSISTAAQYDLAAVFARDPACEKLINAFLFLKGFHALEAQRVAHWLWRNDRRALALLLQSKMSAQLGVDAHPAARLGRGIMFDHASGIVVGETAVIEDDVSVLHSVTLGGTGNETGDRHPKIRRGVLLSAGCKIIGNIEVGEGAKVGAGSVVLSDVPAHVTVAGIPARIVGKPRDKEPALSMDHMLEASRTESKSPS